MNQLYDPEKEFGFVHHCEFSDSYLSIGCQGRDFTDEEKQKWIKEHGSDMTKWTRGRRVTMNAGLLPPLEDVSDSNQSK